MKKEIDKKNSYNFKQKFKLIINENFDIKKSNYNKEKCNFTGYFFLFLLKIIEISFAFWKIISIYIANRVYEKNISLNIILENSKKFWVKKKFNLKKTPEMKYKEFFQISKIVMSNINKFLNLCGSIFFTKFLNETKKFLDKIFNFKFGLRGKNINLRLTEFIGFNSSNFYHFFKCFLFLKLNSLSILVSDVWLINYIFKIKKLPWWRRLKTRECELEYVCKEVVCKICTNSNRRNFIKS